MGANLAIGATVDVGAINAGMADIQELTKKATKGIAISFQEASASTKKAMRDLSDDVKLAAQTVTAESLKVAIATKLQSDAMADLRRATKVASDAQVDAATRTSLLAAAQRKVSEAAAEVAAAKKAEAAAIKKAAEEEELSSNAIVAAFQRAGRLVTEELEGIKERARLVAGEGGLEAEGIASFAGLLKGAFGEALGVGIAADFADQYIDGLAKMNVELDHLHDKSGIDIQTLAGLQQIVKEMGGEWEPVSTALVRIQRAMVQASQGQKEYQEGFTNIGISLKEVQNLKPEQMFYRLSQAVHDSGNQANATNSVIQLLGRGGAALIPVFKKYGDQLEANMKTEGALTGVTEQSAAAARQWTEDTARLSAEFHSVLMPVLEHIVPVIQSVKLVAEALVADLVNLLEPLATVVANVLQGFAGLGKVIYHAVTGDYQAIVSDTKDTVAQIKASWATVGSDFKKVQDKLREDQAKIHWNPLPSPEPEATGVDTGLPGPPAKTLTAVQRDEEELNEIKLEAAQRGYAVGVDQEIRFWDAKLAVARKGSEEYREILAKLAPLEEERARRKPHVLQTEAPDLTESIQAFKDANDEEVKAAKDGARQQMEAIRELGEEESRMAQERYREVEEDSAFEVRMGRETAAERIAALKAAADEEYRVRLQAVQLQELLDLSEAAKYQADLNREMQLTREHNRQITRLNEESAELSSKAWRQAFQNMSADLNRNVARWVAEQRGFVQSMAQMWNQMVQTFTLNVLKMTEQYLGSLLKQKLAHTAANEEQVASDASAAAQSNAISKTKAHSEILDDAKGAAGGAYKAVVGIPVVGPALAPIAAATAFAGVLAFDSFDAGGVVRGVGGATVPILAHAGERVLTPSQTSNFESLVNNNNARTSSVAVNARVQQNFHGATASSARETRRSIQDAVRRGRMRLA